MRKNKLGILAVTMLAAAALAGCGGTKTGGEESAKASSTAAGAETEAAAEAGGSVYPIKTDKSITYWSELNPVVASNYASMDDTPMGKYWQKETGVDIKFEHPAVGQVAEQFNLLMSKEKLPDILEYSWITYPGGPQKAIEDGVIIPLNDIIDKYCPNLKEYLKENPEIDRMVKTDDGTYYCFPFIRGSEKLLFNTGPMVRQDWLDEVGLKRPETVDEWEKVLTAFKDKKGASAPFTYQYSAIALTDNNPFAFAFGAPRGFYINDDGKVHFGAVEEGYKEYLQTMNRWMKNGLLDMDLATLTGDQVSAKITNGSAGASFGYAGSGMGNWMASGTATDPQYLLVPTKWPVTKEGDKPQFGRRENNYPGVGSAAITTSCKNVELAAKLLDWGYSKEGHMAFNFGQEGVSYEMKDGIPTYTDLITHNPDGLSLSAAIASYTRANYSGPFVQDEAYINQYYALDSQKESLKVWSDTDAKKHVIPPITPTVDESKDLAQIMNEIGTYREEMSLKFILGTKSFDEWDDYVKTIQSMKLDRALEIQNAALERYMQR